MSAACGSGCGSAVSEAIAMLVVTAITFLESPSVLLYSDTLTAEECCCIGMENDTIYSSWSSYASVSVVRVVRDLLCFCIQGHESLTPVQLFLGILIAVEVLIVRGCRCT